MTVTIERAGNDEGSFCDVFELLLQLHREGGYWRLDADKAAANCYRTLCEGMTFIARDQDGKAIGVLGLYENSPWFSDETYLQMTWFFVLPEHRKGCVGVALLRAARDEGQNRKKIVLCGTDNPDRRRKKTELSSMFQLGGFIPLGYEFRLR